MSSSKDYQSLKYEEVLNEEVIDPVRKRDEIKIITLKISGELYKELAHYKEKYGYSSRSDFIRDAIKTYMRLLNLLENNSPVTLDARVRDLSEIIEKIIRSKCGFS
ncbi:MAG: CopG family ribbon-helix-helix protein [Sulfolobales archaeon]